MTTAVLTPEHESVSSGRETPEKEPAAEQQDRTLASQQDANPFLDTRRAWNGVWEESLSNARRWRLIKASIASFISDLRLVTPDAGLQAEAVNRVYAYISKGDPALGRVNSFYGATKEASPYVRAVDEIVSVQIDDVLPTSQNSWQVDWTETTRDRKGEKAVTAKWRGLVTIVLVPPSASTSEAQLRRNPLGVYVQDVTWSRLN